jgi:hypothetical protein
MSIDSTSSIDKLRSLTDATWRALAQADSDAIRARSCILRLLLDAFEGGELSADTDIVVFGSLARGEFTSGSDIDWTLLIDGPAKPLHRKTAHQIATVLKEGGFGEPGTTGTFGNLAFSHETIHHIGGLRDTNENLTQRILLLLESKKLRAKAEVSAYDRVVREVIDRYLTDEFGTASNDFKKHFVPRFLFNDIARFWRTMCVDFACKEWEQQGKKWGLRNVKLRMSRKLIFVAGMLTCFSCRSVLESIDMPEDTNRRKRLLTDHLFNCAHKSPLEILCEAFINYGSSPTRIRGVLDPYNEFVEMLGDPEVRSSIESIIPGHAADNPHFVRIDLLSRDFQESLTAFFFDDNTELCELTKKYGVF